MDDCVSRVEEARQNFNMEASVKRVVRKPEILRRMTLRKLLDSQDTGMKSGCD